MGSGIAKQIRSTYPEAYSSYRTEYESGRGLKLGSIIWVNSKGRLIGNAITQEYYGRDPNRRYCSYGAIRSCMARIDGVVSQPPWAGIFGNRVGMPKIGAGLANGDWDTIAQIIEEESTNFQPVVYVWEQDERGGR